MSFIDGPHPLLEERTPAYTNATVRRAFIVWMHCGQRNSFKHVCNYYHQLETLEDKLPADRRAASRQHEFNMFSKPPPTSPYLNQIFPKLYSHNTAIKKYMKKVDVKQDKTILDCFNENQLQNLVFTKEIIETSELIKQYCKTNMIPIQKFLTGFKEYARTCQLDCTISNVVFYIKRKMVEEELLMVENYSKCLIALNINIHKYVRTPPEKPTYKPEEDKVAKMTEQQLTFMSSLYSEKHITMVTNKTQVNEYWNDLTSEINIRNNWTRAW